MADQIFADGPIDAPAKYVVPGSSEIIPIAVQAVLDGANASGDFVPTLIFRSQAGHVIARVPTSTTVAAGGSAEVSWFPGVKSGSSAAATSLDMAFYETDAFGKNYTAGHDNIGFTFLHTNAPGVFSIDPDDPTICTISADGAYLVWGELHFASFITITTSQTLRFTNGVAVNANDELDIAVADATHPIGFASLRGVTFLNVNGGPVSAHFQLFAGQTLNGCDGAGLTIVRQTTAHV